MTTALAVVSHRAEVIALAALKSLKLTGWQGMEGSREIRIALAGVSTLRFIIVCGCGEMPVLARVNTLWLMRSGSDN